MRVYRFTPGWFDEIVVDELNIYWKSDNIKYVLNGYFKNYIDKLKKQWYYLKHINPIERIGIGGI